MLTGRQVTIEIGTRVLARDISFTVGDSDKAGLVGRNGAGKSTLLSAVLGTAGPGVRVSGAIERAGEIGFLPQVPVPGGEGLDPIGLSHVLSARRLDVLDEELTAARRAMAADPSAEHIERFSDLEERYRSAGGYEAEAGVARLADGLGLDQSLLLEDIDGLSGGQRRRVDLVRVLFQQPDLLVLDEPTNHLDVAAKRWLMDELQRFPGSLLVVSHDLRLLDRAITKVLHLADGRLQEFTGTYTSYRRQLAEEQARRERAHTLEEREIRRLSSLADSMRGSTARRARVAKSLDRRVDRLEEGRTQVLARERASVFRLPTPPRSGEEPLRVEQLGVRYGAAPVLRSVGFALGRGDRLAVVGRNGAGKSSLLRCLAGVQLPTTGQVVPGPRVELGYFAQEHEQIDQHRNVLDHIDDRVLASEADRRALLGSFGLRGEVAWQRAGSLSGGERAKLGLAMLAAGTVNLLVLDEPTNNLDPASVQAVGEMLAAWPGTVVVVSHDRGFVEAMAPTHCLHLPAERFRHWREEDLDEVELV